MLTERARSAIELVPAQTRKRALRTIEQAARRLPTTAFTAPMGGRLPLVRPSVSTDKLRERLDGRRVVLTGATSGIGLATAHALGRANADVILVARGEDRLEQVAKEIRALGGEADMVIANLADADDADRVVDRVEG